MKAENLAIFNVELNTVGEVDANQAGAHPLNVEPTEMDNNAGSVHIDAIGEGSENSAQEGTTVDRDRPGDGDGAEAGTIEAVDDPNGGGLGDRTRVQCGCTD